MRRRLLPFSALRAFEAAARCGSFIKAADELGVTPSAVSRQIAELERMVGGPLFVRGVRRIELTPEALDLLTTLSAAFDATASAMELVRDRVRERTAKPYALRVRLLPTFAVRMVIPHLAQFEAEHPGMAVSLKVAERDTSDGNFGYDVTVGYSRQPPNGDLDILFQESAFPVGSPLYLAERGFPGGINFSEYSVGLRLLGTTEDWWDWKAWFQSCGTAWPHDPKLMLFENDDLAIQAAVAGTGLALVEPRFVTCELAEGRLVPSFREKRTVNLGFYVAQLTNGPKHDAALAFSNWLRRIMSFA